MKKRERLRDIAGIIIGFTFAVIPARAATSVFNYDGSAIIECTCVVSPQPGLKVGQFKSKYASKIAVKNGFELDLSEVCYRRRHDSSHPCDTSGQEESGRYQNFTGSVSLRCPGKEPAHCK
jgi:hypothetical protein